MIRSVERALAIFDAFDASQTALTLQGIGKRIGLSKATTHRLVNSLDQAGYLVRVGDHKYSLSLKFVRLAGIVRSTLNVRDIARPIMIEIAGKTGETVSLNSISGNARLCIEVIDTPAPLMHIVRPGEHVPLLYGASGKILLAYMDEAELSQVLQGVRDAETIDRPALTKQLKRFRKQGYALTSGERVLGVSALSVPLSDVDGAVNHCLTLSGPTVRMERRMDEFVEVMLDAGAGISRKLGGPPVARRGDPPR